MPGSLKEELQCVWNGKRVEVSDEIIAVLKELPGICKGVSWLNFSVDITHMVLAIGNMRRYSKFYYCYSNTIP